MSVVNDFRLIGTALSDFRLIGTNLKTGYSCYTLTLEVAKIGAKKGQVFCIKIYFYSGNRAVDFTKKLVGHQVVCTGYVSVRQTAEETKLVELVGQNVFDLTENQNPERELDLELEYEIPQELVDENENQK